MPVAPFQLGMALLKPSQVAARLHVARTTVYGWMQSGELPYIELGGSRYVAVAAYERFVERRKKGVSLEEQAARYIGEGLEVEGEVDRLAGLSSPRTGAAGPPRARAARPEQSRPGHTNPERALSSSSADHALQDGTTKALCCYPM